MRQQPSRTTRVFARQGCAGIQHAERAQRDVVQVSDRGCDDIERRLQRERSTATLFCSLPCGEVSEGVFVVTLLSDKMGLFYTEERHARVQACFTARVCRCALLFFCRSFFCRRAPGERSARVRTQSPRRLRRQKLFAAAGAFVCAAVRAAIARFTLEDSGKATRKNKYQRKGQPSSSRDARALALTQILRDRRSVSYKRDGRLVVGLLLPQTRFPALAKSMEQAARLALAQEDRFSRVKLMVRDSGEQPLRAQRSAAQLLSAKADILIGPVFSAQSLPVAAAADRARKPLLTFSNDEKVKGKFVYRFGLSVREQTAVALNDGLRRPPQAFYKEENKRHKGIDARWGTRVAVLVPQNGYGRLVVQESNAYLRSRGLAPERVDFLDNTLDYETLDGQIRNIADFDYRMLALARYRKYRRRARAQLPQGSATAEEIDIELKKLEKQDTYGPPPFDILLLPEARREALQVVSSYLALYDIDAYSANIYGLSTWGQMRNLWQRTTTTEVVVIVFLKRVRASMTSHEKSPTPLLTTRLTSRLACIF